MDPTDGPVTQPGTSAARRHRQHKQARERRGEEQESRSERAWRLGSEGERHLGGQLDALARQGRIAVLHDLTEPGRGPSNLDHVVVGPEAVWVVDAKAWSCPVRVTDTGVWTGRHGSRSELEGIQAQIARVQGALVHAGRADIPVRGAMCLVNDNEGAPQDRLRLIRGIAVGGVAPTLAAVGGGGRYAPGAIVAVHDVLLAHFVVAGGSTVPPASPPNDTIAPQAPAPRPAVVARRPPRLGGWRPARVIAALLAMLVGLGLLQAALERDASPPGPPLTSAQLRAMRPELARLAAVRADGDVRLRSTTRQPTAFVLRYRRGRTCRVRVTVVRAASARGDAPVVTSSGCG